MGDPTVSLTVTDLQLLIGMQTITIEGKNRMIAHFQEQLRLLDSEVTRLKGELEAARNAPASSPEDD